MVPQSPRPVSAALTMPDVSIDSSDGKYPVIILAHGFTGFMNWSFFPYAAEQLATRLRAAVVRFNFSHNGVRVLPGGTVENPDRLTDADAFAQNTYSQEQRDFQRLITFLTDHQTQFGIDAGRIGLIGHSRGGGQCVLAAAAMPERMKAVALWASVSHFNRYGGYTLRLLREIGFLTVSSPQASVPLKVTRALVEDYESHRADLDILAAMQAVENPVLIVHGAEDKTVSAAEAEALRAANPLQARLHLLPAASHTFNTAHPFDASRTPPKAVSTLIDLTEKFFAETLVKF